MKVYLIVGSELHDSLMEALKRNGFEVTGHQYTLDAAVIALRKKPPEPDLFIVNGLALASGASEGVINRARSMLFKLREIRVLAPRSRVLLILPGQVAPGIINKIVSLGIYDIRQASRFDERTLLGWIENPMSLADYTGYNPGRLCDIEPEEICYGSDQDNKGRVGRLQGGVQAGRGFVSKIASSIGEMKKNMPPEAAGGLKPAIILGIGDTRIEEWIKSNFSDQMTVLESPVEPDEIKDKIDRLSPDICIFMRRGAGGGIADADSLAIWAAERVPAVLFIVGELDENGRLMADRARDAGIRHIITCERGGQIYGDELVYVLNAIAREIKGREPGGDPGGVGPFNGEVVKALGSLLQGVKIKAPLKKPRPRINRSEGISLVETTEKPVTVVKNPTAIVPGGVLAVVSPWRPNLAGRLAAQAVKILSEVEGSEVAYIGTSKNSTGAMWLDVPDEVLMMSDWRVPGSDYPVSQGNLVIYAVDPAKNLSLECEAGLWSLLKEARKTCTYTVMDFAGDMALAEKAVHLGRSVLLAVVPGNDPVEYKVSSIWLRNVMDGKQNIVTGIDLRGAPSTIPEGIRPGVVIRNNPADSLTLALKKISNDEFIWN
ncbi:MAG: hypothetical protein ACOY4I_08240 [Bacillota bacterium]